MSAYLTVDGLRLRTGATCDSLPAEVGNDLCAGAMAVIQAFLGYDPSATTVTEILTTAARQQLPLGRTNVASVTTVHENPQANGDPAAFTTDRLLTAGTDYLLKGSVLVRVNAVWPGSYRREVGRLANTPSECYGCVQAVYECNNSHVLAAAKQAGYLEAAAQLQISRGGLTLGTSESLNGWSYSVSARPAPVGMTGPSPLVAPDAVGILLPFRKTRIAGL